MLIFGRYMTISQILRFIITFCFSIIDYKSFNIIIWILYQIEARLASSMVIQPRIFVVLFPEMINNPLLNHREKHGFGFKLLSHIWLQKIQPRVGRSFSQETHMRLPLANWGRLTNGSFITRFHRNRHHWLTHGRLEQEQVFGKPPHLRLEAGQVGSRDPG